jgi:hypothetical protein
MGPRRMTGQRLRIVDPIYRLSDSRLYAKTWWSHVLSDGCSHTEAQTLSGHASWCQLALVAGLRTIPGDR